MTESIQSIYKITLQRLNALYSTEEAKVMTDRLIENFFHLTPSQRVILGNSPMENEKISQFHDAAEKLMNHVPLQYVLGVSHFMDLEFDVNPSVLIPRPETEELVDTLVKKYSAKNNHKLTILDIGTGSGCIAISLKHYLQFANVCAVDISDEAIFVATQNAVKNKVEVTFLKVDILNPLQWNLLSKADIIISNPPYVTQSEKQFILPNVIDYEPHTALFVPDDDPLVFYRVIMQFATNNLHPKGELYFEINEKFGNELRELAIQQGFRDVNIIFDIQGKSRFLHASN
jgi:release factor glutamine methyltransferase